MKAIGIVAALALMIGAAATCLLAPGYYGYLLGTLATTALVGVGLNVLLGLAGEVSLGQGGFMALGAYGVGILTTKAGLGFWEALPLAVVIVVAISALLSIPALRVTGPYLAMVTIAFGFIVELVSIEWRDLTGGSSGLTGIPAPFNTGGTALLACGFCALALAAFYYFARSPARPCHAGNGIGAGGRAQHRDRPVAGAHGGLRSGRLHRRAGWRVAGSADRLHCTEFVSVLAVDPVSSGGRSWRRRTYARSTGRVGDRGAATGAVGRPCGIPSAVFRSRPVARALGCPGRDRRRHRPICDAGKVRIQTPRPISTSRSPTLRDPEVIWWPKAFASPLAASSLSPALI